MAAGADPDDVLAALRVKARDNARTPVQWDATARRASPRARPWIAVNPNHREINADAERADPDSVFHHYRRLIALRHDEPVVAHGDFTMLLEDDPRLRVHPDRTAPSSCSWSATSPPPLELDVPAAAEWVGAEVLVRTPVSARGPPSGAAMGPWEALVLRRTVG